MGPPEAFVFGLGGLGPVQECLVILKAVAGSTDSDLGFQIGVPGALQCVADETLIRHHGDGVGVVHDVREFLGGAMPVHWDVDPAAVRTRTHHLEVLTAVTGVDAQGVPPPRARHCETHR